MTKENNSLKKAMNYLNIFFWELKINRFLFLFYFIIMVLLFSISVGLLSLASNLPMLIAGELKKANADNINITNLTLNEAETVLSMQIELLDVTIVPQILSIENFEIETNKYFRGGVLFDATFNTALDVDFITEKMLSGRGIRDVSIENDYYPIWVSKKMAEEAGLILNSRFPMIDFDESRLLNVYVAGIFESDEHFDFYISHDIYSKLTEKYFNLRLSLYIRPIEFSEFNRIIAWAEKSKLYMHYNKDVINAVQMVYYTFYVLNLILLFALVGIMYSMLSIYFNRRNKFYAVNLAIGMTSTDILRIMFYLCQFLIFAFVMASFGISFWIINNISSYVMKYFEFATLSNSSPIIPLLINWGLVEILVFIILLRFHKINKNQDIVSIVRYN
ncbi:MAG: hypothetical protein FWC09_02910 [Lachnospiraceae bacterium]|nr:hypothetical protein [Lachnospiraceae bacterium]